MERPLGTVLVIGGCGCVGFHVVKALLEDLSCTSVHVFSRNPNINLLDNVQYHTGSLTSVEDIRAVLQKIQPKVIFHVASPISSGNNANNKLFYDTNVLGTKHLLDCARNIQSVKALVYTSSASVVQEPYRSVTEDRPLIARTFGSNYYSSTKALADDSVLKANDPAGGFRTVCLRITSIYGERDVQMIPGTLKVLRDKRQHMQIGENTSLFDFLSADNAASAQLLAAKALLRGMEDPKAQKIDGEAFFITDDKPVLFWDFSRKIWKAAGDRTPPESIKIIPAWFVIGLAVAAEWLYWIFTLGQRTPKFLRSHTMQWVTSERTFSVEKAKKRLGYRPVDNMEDSIQRGVRWCLEEQN
ncbi:hypothetical protein MMC15_002352 [Xylographa vitiligo]|nr:hypothetical protein [Xylographa vitiligo]